MSSKVLRLCLVSSLLALSLADVASQSARGETARHLVLISIDGFAAFHLDNAAVDLPNIRALGSAGVRGSSETVFPSLTHPAHTTLITGTMPRHHGVTGNRVTDRRTGQRFHITNVPRRQSIKVPTLFDAVHAQGRRTAAFFWPETKDDLAIDDNFAEVFDAKDMADPGGVSPRLLDELRAGGVPVDSYFGFYDDPFGQGAADLALTRAAAHVIRSRRPAFLALHLLVTDKVQHEVGADHYLAHAALTTADHCVGLIRDAIREAGLSDRTTIVIAADHGFATVRDEISLASVLDVAPLKGKVRWIADGWFIWGELQPAFNASTDAAALEQVLARAAAVPGVARVLRPGDFAKLGFPEYSENVFVPGQYLIAGDITTHLAVDPKFDTSRRRRNRQYHGHGYFPDDDRMRAALVMSGAGIASGRDLGRVRNVDVAPTIARVLGVSLDQATGTVLADALQ
jgi:predicted AlkP superfamily pyrophosphatase or phosphodiesterase